MIKRERLGAAMTLGILALLGFGLACGAGKGSYKDGAWEGVSASGMHGEVKVSVAVANGRIREVKIISQNETQGIGSIAIEKLAKEIVETQSTAVTAVSGASVSSKAFLEATADALAKAK